MQATTRRIVSIEFVWWSLCGVCDDISSWNLGRAVWRDTIRVDSASPRGRGQEDVKKSEKGGVSECSNVKYKVKSLSEMLT